MVKNRFDELQDLCQKLIDLHKRDQETFIVLKSDLSPKKFNQHDNNVRISSGADKTIVAFCGVLETSRYEAYKALSDLDMRLFDPKFYEKKIKSNMEVGGISYFKRQTLKTNCKNLIKFLSKIKNIRLEIKYVDKTANL